MTFKKFYNINEGGNAFKETISIQQKDIQKTVDTLESDVLEPLGFKTKGKDWELLGSALKKSAPSGDIDIALVVKSIEHFKDMAENYLEKKGIENKYFPVSKTLSIKYPIPDKEDFVQVDLMFTDDLQYTIFSRFSPHEKDSTAIKTKFGVYRNLFLASIAAEIAYKVLEKNPDGNPKVIEKYALNVEDGLFKNTLDYTEKNLKKPKVLKKELVTKDPAKIVKILLGDTATVADADSFESINKFVQSPKFKYKEKINKIKEKYKVALDSYDLEIPKELGV